jgi:phage shock protein E
MAASHSPEFIALCDKAKARIKQLNPSEVAGVLKSNPNALLVDVREKDEFDSGHLNDALHISRGVLEMNIHKHAKDKGCCLIIVVFDQMLN